MSTQPKTRYTPEEYLALERAAEYKSEYYRGEIFAMSGASRQHNRLTFDLARILGTQLRHRPCEAFAGDMKVHIPATGMYAYPDLSVTCGEREFHDEKTDTLLNPTVIVEVLSPSTEGYDRGWKFENYQSIPSLQQYVLIAQDRVRVDVFTRQGETWVLTPASSLNEVVELASIGCSIPLAELYEGVEIA